MNNSTTAYDLMAIFEAVAKKSAIDEKSCNEMLMILLGQKFRDKIPALLPEGTKVAHKTGNITGIEHDSGIVFLPDGRQYVLVMLSKNLEDVKAAKKVMATISRKIYDSLVKAK